MSLYRGYRARTRQTSSAAIEGLPISDLLQDLDRHHNTHRLLHFSYPGCSFSLSNSTTENFLPADYRMPTAANAEIKPLLYLPLASLPRAGCLQAQEQIPSCCHTWLFCAVSGLCAFLQPRLCWLHSFSSSSLFRISCRVCSRQYNMHRF